RWRRVVVQRPGAMSFQRMDNSFWNAGATIDPQQKTIALTRAARNPENLAGDRTASGNMTFEQPSSDRLVLDGEIEGKRVRMEVTADDPQRLRLVQSRFHWIQNFPVNR